MSANPGFKLPESQAQQFIIREQYAKDSTSDYEISLPNNEAMPRKKQKHQFLVRLYKCIIWTLTPSTWVGYTRLMMGMTCHN